jgi:hypothetical protein
MAEIKKVNTASWLDKIYIYILLVIFGGVVFHAPISVALTTVLPDYGLLIKSWKEILMLVAGLVALYLMYHYKKSAILRKPIILIIAAYAALHLLLTVFNFQGTTAYLAGLAIDLRYLLYFALVYIAMNLYPQYRKTYIRVGIGAALISIVFVILQVTILPDDFLKYIGYGQNTIQPFLTIDQNQNFVRINGTLRGPNPLGAYAGIILTLLVAAAISFKINKDKRSQIFTAILAVGSVVALWFSYSRSAWLASVLSVLVAIISVIYRNISLKQWVAIVAITVIAIGALFTFHDGYFISNVILHENPVQGNNVNSNEGHISSINTGVDQLLHQPLGAGIGSTGSASLLANNSEIIENQYLFIAHEAGWLGLGLFVAIFILVLKNLWLNKKDWLALGLFASGIGLAVIGVFLPVWVDDTVSIVWWGLAGLVCGSRYIVDSRGKNNVGKIN